jgi:hypothetical protein
MSTAPQPADLDVLAPWAPELADTFVALSCDIALVIDAQGRIATLAQSSTQPIAPPAWVGCAWVDTVSPDSRAKVTHMLADVDASGQARRREINHPHAVGGAVPVAYSAARLGKDGPTLAVGHDLRAQTALQQRFVAAQEALERSYWDTNQNQRLGASSTQAARLQGIDDDELVHALDRLLDRIDQDELSGLLQDARRLVESHFMARAAQRLGRPVLSTSVPATSRRASARGKKNRQTS